MENQSTYTGLILISGAEASGIASELNETLAPFSISILDISQMTIRGRVILTALISLNKDHSVAIEEDLLAFAQTRDLDLAIDFSAVANSSLAAKAHVVDFIISSSHLLPGALSTLLVAIESMDGAITNIHPELTSDDTTITISAIFNAVPDLSVIQSLELSGSKLDIRSR
jgi:phosphoserine phosphatase